MSFVDSCRCTSSGLASDKTKMLVDPKIL